MLRLFVAVDLPASEQQAVAALCADVHGARFTKPHQLHITLRFLGATAEQDLSAIRQRLEQVDFPSFHLALRGAGVFPPAATRPRVLWFGLEPKEPLLGLKLAIDEALDEALDRPRATQPHEPKRDFSPHLTLARLAGRQDDSLGRFLARHGSLRGPAWQVACFRLYKSTLHSSGAIHEPLAAYPLTDI